MTDLVKRLRERDKYARAVVGEHRTLVAEAADEIERQQKRFADYALTCGRMLDEKDDEIEQVREALRIGQAALKTALNQVRDTQTQVVALREALELLLKNATTWNSVIHAKAQATVDDTAAVASKTERRLRIEGARAMNEEWLRSGAGDTDGPQVQPPTKVVDEKWPRDSGGMIRPGDAVEGKGVAPGTVVESVEGGDNAGKWGKP